MLCSGFRVFFRTPRSARTETRIQRGESSHGFGLLLEACGTRESVRARFHGTECQRGGCPPPSYRGCDKAADSVKARRRVPFNADLELYQTSKYMKGFCIYELL